jgi:hypothetical protein
MWSNKRCLAIIALTMLAAADPQDAICQTSSAVQLVEVSAVAGNGRVASFIAAFHFNDHLFSASRFALFAITVADVETTWHVIDRGGHELNPVLGQSRAQEALIAGGSVAALTVVTERLYKTGHRKLALIMNVAASGGHGFAAWHNAGIRF